VAAFVGTLPAVPNDAIRRWFKTLRVRRELALGYFCTVTPP
jgi:hypothetical protein